MKETKLQRTKYLVRQIVKACLYDCINDVINQPPNPLTFEELALELDASHVMMNKVSEVKRTRELDTLVRHYFGEDTAADLIDAVNPTEDKELLGMLGRFVFVSVTNKE
jgi:hypothetical protein